MKLRLFYLFLLILNFFKVSMCFALNPHFIVEIQKAVNEAQSLGDLPAIGAYVYLKGKIVYVQSQGKRAIQHEVQVSSKDVWHLGSNTKAMTAFLFASRSSRAMTKIF